MKQKFRISEKNQSRASLTSHSSGASSLSQFSSTEADTALAEGSSLFHDLSETISDELERSSRRYRSYLGEGFSR